MIDAADFDRAAQALDREGFGAAAGRTASWAIRRSGNAIRRKVRERAKPHRKTGRMAQRVQVIAKGTGLHTEVRVKAGGSIAPLIVRGTAPHDIEPVRSRAIAMTAPGRAGALIGYSAVVHHPGTKADPFFARGVADSTGEVHDIIRAAAGTMTRELKYRMERKR